MPWPFFFIGKWSFHSVWHAGLIFKFSEQKMPRRVVRLIISYLYQRRIQLAVGGSLFSEHQVGADAILKLHKRYASARRHCACTVLRRWHVHRHILKLNAELVVFKIQRALDYFQTWLSGGGPQSLKTEKVIGSPLVILWWETPEPYTVCGSTRCNPVFIICFNLLKRFVISAGTQRISTTLTMLNLESIWVIVFFNCTCLRFHYCLLYEMKCPDNTK